MSAARNVGFWKEMERRVVAGATAKARGIPISGSTWKRDLDFDDNESGAKRRIPVPLESGIRESVSDAAPLDGRAMSFTVYKLEDLDARTRLSTAAPSVDDAATTWPMVWASLLAVVNAARSTPRPALKEALRAPLAALQADFLGAMKTLPWKKIAIYGGGAIGTFVFLLFAVVTVADLTDDLKPTHASAMSAMSAMTAPKPAEPVVEAPPPVDAEPAIELDDPAAAAAPAPAAKKTSKHVAHKKKKAAPDLFNP